MGRTCIVEGCRSSEARYSEVKLSFMKLPSSDKQPWRERFLHVIGMSEDKLRTRKSIHICNLHFSGTALKDFGRHGNRIEDNHLPIFKVPHPPTSERELIYEQPYTETICLVPEETVPDNCMDTATDNLRDVYWDQMMKEESNLVKNPRKRKLPSLFEEISHFRRRIKEARTLQDTQMIPITWPIPDQSFTSIPFKVPERTYTLCRQLIMEEDIGTQEITYPTDVQVQQTENEQLVTQTGTDQLNNQNKELDCELSTPTFPPKRVQLPRRCVTQAKLNRTSVIQSSKKTKKKKKKLRRRKNYRRAAKKLAQHLISMTPTQRIQYDSKTTLHQVKKKRRRQVRQISKKRREFLDKEKAKNFLKAAPKCGCNVRKGKSPFYDHTTLAKTEQDIKNIFMERTGLREKNIKLLIATYTSDTGVNDDGCPQAKWTIERTNREEKLLIIMKRRLGHFCKDSIQVISVVFWDALEVVEGDQLYKTMAETLPENGYANRRRCRSNNKGTCCCQGEEAKGGVCFTYGCCLHWARNRCKFSNSSDPNKFRLLDETKQSTLELILTDLADYVARTMKCLLPKAYKNMTQFDNEGRTCRIGNSEKNPYSGATVNLDFSTHVHTDVNNMYNGCAAIISLCPETKLDGEPNVDEQLHLLANYRIRSDDRTESVTSGPTNDDNNKGGIGIRLTHGSLLFECAKMERHATTRLLNPSRKNPSRISIVFFQHRMLNQADHGYWDPSWD